MLKITIETEYQKLTHEDTEECRHDTADEFLTIIRQLMLGMGYQPESITNAMLSVAEEYENV